MQDHPFDVVRVTGALGAEIQGLDLSESLSNAQAAGLRQALLDHKVIFLRDQKLTPERHMEIGRLFGKLYRIQHVQPLEGYPYILDIVKEPADAGKYNFGGAWHSDMSYVEEPAMGSLLYALEVPPHGGDTLWCSTEAAYDSLSDGMKRLLSGLTALHSGRRSYGVGGKFAHQDMKSVSMSITPSADADRLVPHPVVRTHPETGRKGLYVNPNYTICFADMSEEESESLLSYLYRHMTRPEFICRFRWTAGTLAIWDNRSTMHRALNDYDGYRRHMNRVTIAGDRPA